MKYNIKIEINLNKLNKNKLLDIINTQQIPIYNQIELVKEILDIEKYINNLEIIYYNYLKFKNIHINIIKNIQNNNFLNANDLDNIIILNNLIIDTSIDNIKNYNKMIYNISNALNNYKIKI
jgi:hypothetical protein